MTPHARPPVVGEDQALVRLAVTLLFTYPGVPCVYYGDEIGLAGGRDPDCRRCMIWNPHHWNHDLREFYRTLIRLRRTALALCHGSFQLLHATGQTLAFQRESPNERLLIIARRANDGLKALSVRQAGLPDGIQLRDLLTGSLATVTGGVLPLDSLANVGAQIWQVVSG